MATISSSPRGSFGKPHCVILNIWCAKRPPGGHNERPMGAIPQVFFNDADRLLADTCEPLKAAARAGALRLDAWGRGGYPGRPIRGHALPGVRSVGMWDATARQNWGLDWHRNEGVELTWLQRGRAAFATRARRYRLRPGDFTVTRPWQPHRIGDPHVGASRLVWVILDVAVRRPDQRWRWPPWIVLDRSDLDRLTLLLRHNAQPVWRADRPLAHAFERLADLLTDPAANPPWSRYKIVINELLVGVLETLERQRVELDPQLSTTEHTVELFLQALPRHAAHPWTIDAMARQCGLHANRFGQLCRKLTNLTPGQHLTRSRVELAARLLREQPDWSITRVALASGFQSSQYFATVFRRCTGLSPSAYRARPDP